jgi:PAS domain S-box-containing protein
MAAIAGDEIHGRRTSEFVGRPDADPTAVVKGSPGGRTLFDDLIDGTVDQAHQERRWIAPGSDIESVEFHNSAVRDDNGEFLYAIGITRDITPRRRAEQER